MILLGKELSYKTFYKMSKSTKEIAQKCIEPHFLAYHEDSLLDDSDGQHRICFVPAEMIFQCIAYGDQLTEIKFDPLDNRFCEIANEIVNITNSVFKEHNMRKVIIGKIYSLFYPSTLAKMIEIAGIEEVKKAMRFDVESNIISVSRHLLKLGCHETLEYWKDEKAKLGFF